MEIVPWTTESEASCSHEYGGGCTKLEVTLLALWWRKEDGPWSCQAQGGYLGVMYSVRHRDMAGNSVSLWIAPSLVGGKVVK